MRARIGLLLGAAALGALTACTPGRAAPSQEQPVPAPSQVGTGAPSGPTTPAATAAAPADVPDEDEASAEAAVHEALECLHGTWRMTSFAIEANSSVTTRGEGGDVWLGFEDDSWWLHGSDDEPVTVSMGSKEAELRLEGRAEGSVDVTAEGVRYSVDDSEGRVEMELPEGSAEHGMPLRHFLATIMPSGSTTLECAEDEATISSGNTSVNQVLNLRR